MLITAMYSHSVIRKHVLQAEPSPLPTGHSGEFSMIIVFPKI